jgi:hypothetical protein
MTIVKVRIADERLDELEQVAQNAITTGEFRVVVSAPELLVLVGGYREQQAGTDEPSPSPAG